MPSLNIISSQIYIPFVCTLSLVRKSMFTYTPYTLVFHACPNHVHAYVYEVHVYFISVEH